MTAVLDAWAVMAYLRGESAADRTQRAIDDGALMSWINLGEVLYLLHRAVGADRARATIRDLRSVIEVEVPGVDRITEAAVIKAEHPLSYADAFAAATALAHDAPLLTGDPELLTPAATWTTVDLRQI